MKINKKNISIGISIIFIIFFISCISAFGLGCAYHKDYPLRMTAGETKEIIFNLQNMVGTETIVASPSITKGSEILEFVDSGEITVSVKGSVDVKAIVDIPQDAKIEDIYPIEVAFTTITKTSAGAFGFGSSVGRGFNVIIIPTTEQKIKLEKQKQINSLIKYLAIAIAILIIIILIVWKLIKKKQ